MLADVLRDAVEAIDEWLTELGDFQGFDDVVDVRDQMDRLRARLDGGDVNPHPSQAEPPFSEVLSAASRTAAALNRLNSELDDLLFRRRVKLTEFEAEMLRGIHDLWVHRTGDKIKQALENLEEGTP